jgi:hypothetical protein
LGAKILDVKTVLVGHDATSIFLYLHHAVKGRERNGGKMIASEFGDRSPAQHGTGQMITSFKHAWLVPVAFLAAAFRAAIPNH